VPGVHANAAVIGKYEHYGGNHAAGQKCKGWQETGLKVRQGS
jgi:hypothetical protein